MRFVVLAGMIVGALVLVAAGCGGSDDQEAGAPVPFDRAFIDAMVPHHVQAIEMARSAKAAGLSEPVLVEIADAIEETQQREIDQMKDWRGKWFGSSEIDPDGADSLEMSMEEMGMEGTMDFSEAEDVDGAFATMMVAHHEGAIAMAELAQERSERQEIRSLADEIVAAQEAEVVKLRPFATESMDSMPGMHG